MNFLKRFKSLPVSTKKLLGLGVVLAMVVALPLFIWAVITQNFNPFKKAASGEPGNTILCQAGLVNDFNAEGIDTSAWTPSDSQVMQQNGVLTISGLSGEDNYHRLTSNNWVNGNFQANVDIKQFEVASAPGVLATAELKAYADDNNYFTIRWVKWENGFSQINLWSTISGQTTQGTGVNVPSSSLPTLRLIRIGNTIRGFYSLGGGFYELPSISAAVYTGDVRPQMFIYKRGNVATSTVFDDFNLSCPTALPTSTPIPTPTPTPTGTPTPTSTPISCSSVTVIGATYGGSPNGQDLYYLPSGGSATLHANTSPGNLPVNWKAQFSSQLLNGGSFSTNYTADTVYTAPTNSGSTDQGVEIRGDISEYPNPWIYCPPFTIAIKPQSIVGARSFEIFFKFDGVTDNSAEEQGAKVNVRFVSRSLDPAGLETGQRPVNYVDNGVYKLLVDIEPGMLPAADDYSINIKGEKHLHVRFCENGQTTHCSLNQSGHISLPQNQVGTMLLNFIGIPLPAGDTPIQDGGVDANDYNLIRTLTSKISTSLSPTEKFMGDLNYDGKIDTLDLFLIRKTLGTRYD